TPQAAASRQVPSQPVASTKDDRFYSPLVKNIAKTEGIAPQELATIPGSGLDGRVNKNDMLKYVEARKPGGVQRNQQQTAPANQAGPSFAPSAPQPKAT